MNKSHKRFKNSPKERTVEWRKKGARYYYLYEPEELYSAVKKAGFKITEKPIPTLALPIIVKKP